MGGLSKMAWLARGMASFRMRLLATDEHTQLLGKVRFSAPRWSNIKPSEIFTLYKFDI